MPRMSQPVIGITTDNDASDGRARYQAATAYSHAVTEAGGTPILLPHVPELTGDYTRLCDALVLTGGGDPATEPFGIATDARARVIHPDRQAFELALLDAAEQQPNKPVLGVCLGMQLMALRAGAGLDQYLPDMLPTAIDHQDDRKHPLLMTADDSAMQHGGIEGDKQVVVSSHRQAVAKDDDQPSHAGVMRVIAVAPDGVIEAIDDPARRFYIGVQWHPERGDAGPFNRGLFQRLIQACRAN